MKKRTVLLCFSAFFYVVLLGLCCYLFFVYHAAKEDASYPPFQTAANERASVGYLRISDLSASLMENKDDYQIELLGMEPSGSSQEFYELTFQATAKRDTEHMPDCYDLLWFCPEDNFWYVRYSPYCVEKMYSQIQPAGTTSTETIQVPADIFAQPGKYRVVWNYNQAFIDFDFDNT